MKLVDILSRELKVWPEGMEAAYSSGHLVRFCTELGTSHSNVLDIGLEPEDQASALVTRAEWQAAVDALNAPKVVEWDGVSLPPKGTAVEVRFACEKIGSEWPWHYGVVVASGPQPEGGAMVAVESNGFTVALRVTSDFIRPARTDEQVAAEEREKAAKELYMTINWDSKPGTWENLLQARRDDYRKAIDAGYRKEPKSCGS